MTMVLPLPGQIKRFSTAGSYYSADFSRSAKRVRHAVWSQRRRDRPATAACAGRRSRGRVGPQHFACAVFSVACAANLLTRAGDFQASLPAAPQDPEDSLAMLQTMLPPMARSQALAVPAGPMIRPPPLSAQQACRLLGPDTHRAQALGEDGAEVQLVKEICKAAGQQLEVVPGRVEV